MNKVNLGEYYIVTPDERRTHMRITRFCLLYVALLAGLVWCAVKWARSQAPKDDAVWQYSSSAVTE